MTLTDKNVLVTGASRGLGAALARALAARGARVVLNARDASALEQVVQEIRSRGGSAFAVPGDVADKEFVYPLVGSAAALAGPLDIVVHNASTLGKVPLRFLLDSECEDLEQALRVNLVGPFRISKAVAGAMALRGSGLLVHVSSDAAVQAYPSWGFYSVTKAALDHLSRLWAAELNELGVRSFSVDPGEMNTVMHSQAVPDADPCALLDPAFVAERIASMLANSTQIANGARLEAGSWQP